MNAIPISSVDSWLRRLGRWLCALSMIACLIAVGLPDAYAGNNGNSNGNGNANGHSNGNGNGNANGNSNGNGNGNANGNSNGNGNGNANGVANIGPIADTPQAAQAIVEVIAQDASQSMGMALADGQVRFLHYAARLAKVLSQLSPTEQQAIFHGT